MLNTTHNPNINPALYTNAAEFFAYGENLDCIQNGQRYSFESTPERLKAILAKQLAKDSIARKALKEWAKKEPIDELRQYTYCLLGGFDAEPDIDANGIIQPGEFNNCPMRSQCKHVGKICKGVSVANGTLTKTETEVLMRVTLANENIAEKLFVSVETISSHQQNIRRKTGFNNKAELAALAAKKGIIQ